MADVTQDDLIEWNRRIDHVLRRVSKTEGLLEKRNKKPTLEKLGMYAGLLAFLLSSPLAVLTAYERMYVAPQTRVIEFFQEMGDARDKEHTVNRNELFTLGMEIFVNTPDRMSFNNHILLAKEAFYLDKIRVASQILEAVRQRALTPQERLELLLDLTDRYALGIGPVFSLRKSRKLYEEALDIMDPAENHYTVNQMLKIRSRIVVLEALHGECHRANKQWGIIDSVITGSLSNPSIEKQTRDGVIKLVGDRAAVKCRMSFAAPMVRKIPVLPNGQHSH